MRVIAGSARRLLLKSVPGNKVRPTSDLMKETLFNILGSDVQGSRFLDLFSGTGGISIEALSRGAKEAVIVEQYKPALACIKENLEHTKFTDKARIIPFDVFGALNSMKNCEKFDIIFMDPPYGKGFAKKILTLLPDLNIMTDNTLVVIEEDVDTDLEDLVPDYYEVVKVRKYGAGVHIFLNYIDDEEKLS